MITAMHEHFTPDSGIRRMVARTVFLGVFFAALACSSSSGGFQDAALTGSGGAGGGAITTGGSTGIGGASRTGGAVGSGGSSTTGACIGATLLASFGKDTVLVGGTMADATAAKAPFDGRYLYLSGGLFDGTAPCASCASALRRSARHWPITCAPRLFPPQSQLPH